MNCDFDKELYTLLGKKREEMKQKYNRVLPTNELLFNRFDKAMYLGAGKGTSVYDSSVIMGNIEIGDNVWIGPYTLLEGINDKIIIGNYVTINTGAMIYTHDSTKYYVSGGKHPFESGPVSIGDNTVIGSHATIKYGVKVGSRCVIGAHSFVTVDVPDDSIVAGTPARVIGRVVIEEEQVLFKYNEEK